ncbi:MAG: ATP-binding cassette domain-containing protein [Patescibacteria group bacterium]|jgi:ABC-2 type transport system ATP-binding protein
MINVNNLIHRFGTTIAVNDISFKVDTGEVVGFLGPNGAGKTTTMRLLTGYLQPVSGTIEIDNRQDIGYLPENNPLYETQRVYEYLEFIARAKNITALTSEIKRVVRETHLSDKINLTISELSKGYRQRVGLAAALLGDPKVLLLDEPTSGLDPNQSADIRQLIRTLGKTKSVLFSTHILQEVQSVCDRAIIINRGKIVGQGTVAELVAQAEGKKQLHLTITGSVEAVRDSLNKIEQVTMIDQPAEQQYVLETPASVDIRKTVFDLCVAQHWTLLEMQQTQVSLEEVFHQLTA